MKLRKRARLLVYASERMTTAGISILSAYLPYTFMIRKRLCLSASLISF